jgi:acyl-coenzyme A thioesterase PaaI-like protein
VQPRTHLAIDRRLCGEARVVLETLPEMAADDAGLVHGGFVFGLADHAAMLAVNDPFVVLGQAEVRFLRPVRVGERLLAAARREEAAGRRSRVAVEVRRTAGGEDGGEVVMRGEFVCLSLDRHVLEGAGA